LTRRAEYIEEAGASNFFAAFHGTNTIVTQPLEANTSLPGVTRLSIIQLARTELGWNVEERSLKLSELNDADEAFCCGTGKYGCKNIYQLLLFSVITSMSLHYFFYLVVLSFWAQILHLWELSIIILGEGTVPLKFVWTMVLFLEMVRNLVWSRNLCMICFLGYKQGDFKDNSLIQKYKEWIYVVDP